MLLCKESSGSKDRNNLNIMEGLLLKSLNDQRQSNILCDVVLIVENEEFSAHKGILAANSNYFMAMFTTNMVEKEQEKVILREFQPSAVREILDFVYTGQLEVNRQNVRKLLEASNFLLISRVTEACCRFLESILDEENCLSIISISDEFDCQDLHKTAVKFLYKQFQTISKTEEFMELCAEEIKTLLSSDEINVDNENQLLEILINWVNFNHYARRKHYPELLKLIRFNFLQPALVLDNNILCKELGVVQQCFSSQKGIMEGVDNMATPRKSYSTVAVIIVAGGVDDSRILDTVSCFIPSMNKWCDLAKMNSPRWRLEMASTDTAVVVVGGLNEVSTTHPEIPFLEKYDARKDSWEPLPNPDLPFPVDSDSFRTTRLGNEVIFIGEINSFDNRLTSNVFCVRDIEDAPKFEPLSAMLIGRYGFCVAASSEHVFAIGGSSQATDGHTPFGEDIVEKYDRKTDSWTSVSPLNQPRFGAAAVSIDNKIYVIGGCHGRVTHQSGEVYDPVTDSWTFIAPMATARMSCATTVHDGKLWVLGGVTEPRGSALSSVECYDPKKDRWSTVAPLDYPRRDFNCCVADIAYRTISDAFNGDL